MTRATRKLAFALATAMALLAIGAFVTPASATDRTFRLYVSPTEGWGFTNTSLKIPGPNLVVGWRDNVTLVLNATSGTGHRWYIDYNNDAFRNANEPQSPTFSAGAPSVSWNFTADRNGTFLYRDRAAPSMWGLILVDSSAGIVGAPADAATLVVVGVGAAVVAAFVGFALGVVYARRPRMMPPAPPPSNRQP